MLEYSRTSGLCGLSAASFIRLSSDRQQELVSPGRLVQRVLVLSAPAAQDAYVRSRATEVYLSAFCFHPNLWLMGIIQDSGIGWCP